MKAALVALGLGLGVAAGPALAAEKAMPNASFKTFDALGHNLAWEDPEAVAGEIAAFLRQ